MTFQKFSPEQYKHFKNAFALFDTDNDGVIDVKELAGVMQYLGYKATKPELRKLIREIDGDSDGYLDFSEFNMIMARKLNLKENKDKILKAFRLFDQDSKGYISLLELRYILTHLGDKLTLEEVDNMIHNAGLSNFDHLHYEEFVLMFMR